MSQRFLALFFAASTVVTAAVLLLIAGLRDGKALTIGTGSLLALIGVLGVIALARMVVLTEREARRR